TITELLLRGRQTLGELRTRASRMVPIDSLEELRADLQKLMDQGYVQSNGPLDRRGVEVDHAFYEPQEGRGMTFAPQTLADDDVLGDDELEETEERQSPAASNGHAQVSMLVQEVSRLRDELQEARQEIESCKERVTQLGDELADLRRDLGA
ncbi:MAG: DUF480 domain-containing protein, partial [Planctomycetaceae bacterium]|nr:DUF480 domain-containing protein [Planctomycetaceae bacterium]